MSSFIQILVSGLATGAIYALVAVGFTLLWQTSQTINFAQGEFVMLPAFFMLAAMNAGAPVPLAALIGIALAVVVLGLLFKLVIVDPMLRHGVLPLVISTIALSLFIKESVKVSYSSQAQPFPHLVPAEDIEILGGVILGVLDNLSAAYISSQYRGAFPLIILIAVILLRPHGLLGRVEERTV